MCIIAAKAAGIPMPSRDTLRTMWDNNHDGAGFMYTEKGKVRIEKGFMKYEHFIKALEKVESRLDLTKTPVVLHFRITTHGGTKPENCHPFPITDSVGALKKLTISTDVGVAHNGIIPIDPRRGISDTMEYIASQLSPLKRALPRFYENKNAMLLVENAIHSRMVFLTGAGRIYTIGDFVSDGGVLYSNESYLSTYHRFRSSTFRCWPDDLSVCALKHSITVRRLMWLPEDDYVTLPTGEIEDGYDYLIDETGAVYSYDWDTDAADAVYGAQAYTPEDVPARFVDDDAEPIDVLLYDPA